MQPPGVTHMFTDATQPGWDDSFSGSHDLFENVGDILQPTTAVSDGLFMHQEDFLTMFSEEKFPERIDIQRVDSNFSEASFTGTGYPQINYAADLHPHTGQMLYPTALSSNSNFSSPTISATMQSEATHSSSSTSPKDGVVITSEQAGTSMGLQLKPAQSYYLKHFIENVNLNFTSVVEVYDKKTKQVFIEASNFWTFVIPSMAMRSAPLLHAVLAISALHEANINNRSEHQALLDYHQSIRKLAKAFQKPGAKDRHDLLATCLILAYFETMGGETVKWGRHLQGACDLVRGRILNTYAEKDCVAGKVAHVSNPTIVEHLIWFHIHQDTIQALLSGNGLFLDLKYIEMVPLRNDPGTIMYASDQLRVILARVGDFACKDRQRKEDAFAGPAEYGAALTVWTSLMSSLQTLSATFGPVFTPQTLPGHMTPCGSAVTFKHPSIASLQMMHAGAVLYLHRGHPELPPVPAEAIRLSARTTFSLVRDIVRMMAGVMVASSCDKNTDQGSHLKAMINGVLPVFLAAIALQDEGERSFVEGMLRDIYSLTGWRTVSRVLQGLDIAWQRHAGRMTDLAADMEELTSIETNGVLEQRYVVLGSKEPDVQQTDIEPRHNQHHGQRPLSPLVDVENVSWGRPDSMISPYKMDRPVHIQQQQQQHQPQPQQYMHIDAYNQNDQYPATFTHEPYSLSMQVPDALDTMLHQNHQALHHPEHHHHHQQHLSVPAATMHHPIDHPDLYGASQTQQYPQPWSLQT